MHPGKPYRTNNPLVHLFFYLYRLSIKDLKLLHVNKTVNVTATVKTMKTIENEVSTKNRLQGLLMDATGKIDFIVWGSELGRVSEQLQENQTYIFTNVKVNTCDDKYCTTTSGLQLVFTHRTTMQASTDGPFQSYVSITPLDNVLQYIDSKINIAGKICNTQKVLDKRKKKTDKLIVSIIDENIKLDTCFYDTSADRFTGKIGDIMVLENVTIKNYGAYNVVNASKAICLINESGEDTQHLKDIDLKTHIRTDLSPKKDEAEEINNIDDLQETSQTQQFTATPTDLSLYIYDSCPLLTCKKKVHQAKNLICTHVTSVRKFTR